MLLCLFEKWKWKMLPSVRSPCWCPVEPCRRCLVQASCIIQICKQTWKQRKRMRRHLIQTLIQAKFWNFAKMKRWHIYLFLSRLLWSLSRMPSGMPPMMFTTSSSFTGISRQLLVEKDDNQIAISMELSKLYRTIVRTWIIWRKKYFLFKIERIGIEIDLALRKVKCSDKKVNCFWFFSSVSVIQFGWFLRETT